MGLEEVTKMEILRFLYILFILCSIPVYEIVAYKLLQSYKQTGHKQTLSIAVLAMFGGFAICALMLEQTILELSYSSAAEISNNDIEAIIARILVVSAIGLSLVSIIASDLFGLYFLDRKFLKLIYPLGLFAIIYFLLYAFLPFEWIKQPDIWEYGHNKEDELLLLSLYLLPVWLSPLILTYATILLRESPNYLFRRSLLLTAGQFIIAIAYTFQIITPTIFSAIGFFYYPIHMYIVFTLPEWFKKLIGAP